MSQCYCILLRKASRKLSAYYDEAMAPVGVNIAQFSMLRAIDRAAPISLTDLARRLELDRSTVGRNVKVLQKMGMVEPAASEDGREAAFAVAAAGGVVLRDGAALWDEAQAAIEARLGAEATALLKSLPASL
ncbi:MAG: MarR family transcriptional regulator [Rhizobiaceae bacterium]|nr:MarR family transcriptional regulator [Rhizobiaceae bacterium]